MEFFDEMIESWRYTREGVIAEVKNFPDDEFMRTPLHLKRTALDLVNHIVESGRLMSGELSRPDGDFQRKSYFDLIKEHTKPGDEASSKSEAIALLERSHAEGEAMLKAAGAELMAKPIRQFNGVPASRLSWMTHGVSHEEYHRGQLALYARLAGETPALTKLIEGS
ncbi:MAG TPA: DinB family protein [Gemmatimonadaceae bacterium]|jgi:uncharacterized damage-inducible protein DinB|nr:DinB family protein [Gemmatimonadaceae bacterium]